MRRNTVTLIGIAAVLYYAVVFLVRGFFPTNYSPPLPFLLAPLIGLVLVLLADLSSRATLRTEVPVKKLPHRTVGRDVRFLTEQIDAATRASPEYFDRVLRSRLREALAEKVSLETGIEKEKVRATLEDPRLGPGLLRDRRLYDLLYSRLPARDTSRVKMLEETVTLVEGWNA